MRPRSPSLTKIILSNAVPTEQSTIWGLMREKADIALTAPRETDYQDGAKRVNARAAVGAAASALQIGDRQIQSGFVIVKFDSDKRQHLVIAQALGFRISIFLIRYPKDVRLVPG